MPNYKIYKSKNHPEQTINAIQFTGHNLTDVRNFLQSKATLNEGVGGYFDLNVTNDVEGYPEVTYLVALGDWIIEYNNNGEVYTLPDYEIKDTYQLDV